MGWPDHRTEPDWFILGIFWGPISGLKPQNKRTEPDPTRRDLFVGVIWPSKAVCFNYVWLVIGGGCCGRWWLCRRQLQPSSWALMSSWHKGESSQAPAHYSKMIMPPSRNPTESMLKGLCRFLPAWGAILYYCSARKREKTSGQSWERVLLSGLIVQPLVSFWQQFLVDLRPHLLAALCICRFWV